MKKISTLMSLLLLSLVFLGHSYLHAATSKATLNVSYSNVPLQPYQDQDNGTGVDGWFFQASTPYTQTINGGPTRTISQAASESTARIFAILDDPNVNGVGSSRLYIPSPEDRRGSSRAQVAFFVTLTHGMQQGNNPITFGNVRVANEIGSVVFLESFEANGNLRIEGDQAFLDLSVDLTDDYKNIYRSPAGALGDLNNDGQVNFADFLIMGNNFGSTGDHTNGDLNCDGVINFQDFLVLASLY